jgi:predicted flap endonuclease-1-like 5' DNA nuclease
MTTAIILLNNCTFTGNLPMALALCIVPFILGWLAAWIFHKVGSLKSTIGELTTDTQLDAEIENLNGQIRKVKNDLIICESERNILKGKQQKPATVMFAGAKVKYDNLEIVEGIGPKIAELLKAAGIDTWLALAESTADKIREILDGGGSAFQMHDPSTWPAQARLAENGDLDGLKKLQDELNAGK